MPRYASSDLVAFGLRAEATEGTFDVAGAFATQLTNGITPEFGSNIITDPTVSGAGEPVDARTNLRSLDLTTPMQLRYKDLVLAVGAALRSIPPAEVTIVGSSDIDVLTAGTHLDGSTGPQLRVTEATPAAFDDLITYGGVTSSTHPRGGAEALMMKISGSAQANNNVMRRVKAVWKDAGASYVDILPGYVGGTAGQFGSPLVGTTLESLTLRVGAAMRNQIRGSGVRSFSGLWNFSDMVNNGGWQSGFGLVANDLGVSWSGHEGAVIEIPWIGYGAGTLVDADPSGQGFDDSALLFSDMMIAAEDLLYCSIVTASKPIVLSQFNITGLTFTLAGNSAGIDNVSGTSKRSGVRRGSHMPSGSLEWYLADDARSEEIVALGAEGTAEKGGIDIVFRDRAGNDVILGLLNNEFGHTGPIPGSGGNTVGGTLNYTGARFTKTSRSFTWQEFAAA